MVVYVGLVVMVWWVVGGVRWRSRGSLRVGLWLVGLFGLERSVFRWSGVDCSRQLDVVLYYGVKFSTCEGPLTVCTIAEDRSEAADNCPESASTVLKCVC